MSWLNNFLFIALPYTAMAVFLVGFIWRYRSSGFKVSSLSAQFLEGRRGFWGTVPFHWGILAVFTGHLAAFLVPRHILWWNGQPVRLIILEVTAFVFGLSLFIGLLSLFIRRLTNPRIRMVTWIMDIVIEVVLLLQVILGLWIALGYRWGSSWFAADMSPYLWSLVKFDPQITAMSAMPLPIQLHVVGAFVILFLIPFTRLVHFLVVPLHYLWRPYQKVMWHWNRRTVRNPRSAWSTHRPKNN